MIITALIVAFCIFAAVSQACGEIGLAQHRIEAAERELRWRREVFGLDERHAQAAAIRAAFRKLPIEKQDAVIAAFARPAAPSL